MHTNNNMSCMYICRMFPIVVDSFAILHKLVEQAGKQELHTFSSMFECSIFA